MERQASRRILQVVSIAALTLSTGLSAPSAQHCPSNTWGPRLGRGGVALSEDPALMAALEAARAANTARPSRAAPATARSGAASTAPPRVRAARGVSNRGGALPGGRGPLSATARTPLGARTQAACYGLATCTTAGGEDDWALWWALNEDEVIWDAPEPRTPRGATTRAGRRTVGPRRADDLPGARASRGQVYTRIVPTLLELLEECDDPDVLDASALALGGAVEPDLAEPVRLRLETLLSHPSLNVAASSTLALGLLGDPAATPLLLDLATCSVAGHDLVGAEMVPRRQRAVAALALGYLGDDLAAPFLLDLVQRGPASDFELKTCTILALGLIDGPESRQALAALVADLTEARLDDAVASAIPTAVARAGARELLPDLLALVHDPDTDRRVLHSTVTALGRLADLDDAEVLEALETLTEEGRHGPTRRQAWIALARMGAADPSPQVHGAFHDDFTHRLVEGLRRPRRDVDRPWIALAAGFYGRDREDTAPRRIEDALTHVFDDVKDPGARGALALAAGLVGAEGLGPAILDALDDTHDDLFRSHAALALGLLGHEAAVPRLREFTEAKGLAADVRRSAARALGLLADADSARHLTRRLGSARTSQQQRECALVLGQLRSSQALAGLADLAADEEADGLTRAMACGALGRVAEKTERPWASRVCGDLNYLASAAAVLDQLPVVP